MAATYLAPVSKRRRALAFGLTILFHLLVALLLLNLAPDRWERLSSDTLSTFDVAPDSGEAPQPAPRQPQQQRQQRQQQRAAAASPPRPAPPPEPEVKLPDFLKMSRADFAATDLARTARKAAPGDAADTPGTAAANADSSSSYGPGAGPGGARLYNAEWVREPTGPELNPFLPATPAGSWGEVACRTIPNNRVENCQLIGESPLGSKLATGIRRAAWQFQIRPPRVGGQPQVGEWVRIRIEITDKGAALRR